MSRPRLAWKVVITVVSVELSLVLLGALTSAWAQEPSSRRVREYRRPWRSGVVSFGLQGEYGHNGGGTEFTDPFKWGPGLVVSARYAANRWASLGVRFEVHNYGAERDTLESANIWGKDNPEQPIDSQRVTLAGIDFYLYRDRTKETMYYSNFGAGIHQMTILQPKTGLLDTQSSRSEEDRLYLMGGLGLEHFLRRTIAFDLNGKVFAYLGDEEGVPLSFQLAAGLQFYFFD